MMDPQTKARHYQERAATILAMAEREANEKMREELLALADQYAALVVELLQGAPITFPNKH